MKLFKSMKTKLVALAATAALLFTGVGFAAWVATEEASTRNTKNQAASNLVACEVNLNDDFELKLNGASISNLYLIFDAPTTGTATHAAGNGVYWSTSNTQPFTNKVEGNVLTIEGTLDYSANDIEDLASITITYSDNGSALVGNTYVEFGSVNVPAAQTITTFADGQTITSAAFALPTVSYTSAVQNADSSTVATGVSASLGYKVAITAHTSL